MIKPGDFIIITTHKTKAKFPAMVLGIKTMGLTTKFYCITCFSLYNFSTHLSTWLSMEQLEKIYRKPNAQPVFDE
jgi:hypothetical protein